MLPPDGCRSDQGGKLRRSVKLSLQSPSMTLPLSSPRVVIAFLDRCPP
jgi:hypothetical protein